MLFKYGMYTFSVSFGLWHAAHNPDALETWAAATSGMVFVLTGVGLTTFLSASEQPRRFDLWLRWSIRRFVRRILLVRRSGYCDAVHWIWWLRCTRARGHPNLHSHEHVDCDGAVVRLTGWPR